MVVLVRDGGFVADDWRAGYAPLAAMADEPEGGPEANGVDIASPDLTRAQWARLCRLLPGLGLVRIRLRHFGDVTALDLARSIRCAGYRGRLRAHGAVLARCYTLTRRAGFDEVELDSEQARLQPAEHWRNEPGWRPYRRRGADMP